MSELEIRRSECEDRILDLIDSNPNESMTRSDLQGAVSAIVRQYVN